MADGRVPTGTVTFLFTDLEGSTRLWEEHPDAMQPALARHDEIVRAAIEAHGGHVVKSTGDGFHAAFRTAQDALDAALDAQRAACRRALGGDRAACWCGWVIHTGETQERDGDYYGTAVNRAARVMAVAHGGQILCSRATVEVAGAEFPVRSLGEHRLRDLGAPQEIFQVGDGVVPAAAVGGRGADEPADGADRADRALRRRGAHRRAGRDANGW